MQKKKNEKKKKENERKIKENRELVKSKSRTQSERNLMSTALS